MPRDLPIGNGSLLVNFDQVYQLRDIYWPHVGQDNHTAGHPFRFGLWIDGQFGWVHQPNWQRSLKYQPGTLVTDVNLVNPALSIRLDCQDIVDFHENLYLRKITIYNDCDRSRQIRLFFAQDFLISETEVGDTAYYEPERKALYHYKGKVWFLINTGKFQDDEFRSGIDAWAVGITDVRGYEGTWRDAEDGILSGNSIAQGSVDSCVALHINLQANGTSIGWYWIAAGADFQEVTRLNRLVRQRGAAVFLDRTCNYWSFWASAVSRDLQALPANLIELYRLSLLIMRTQIDNQGAILAANDYDITSYARDTYSYMWPRDGALVAVALLEAGFSEPPRRFFEFCQQVITPEGYFLHKYNPDGSLASSWHAWYQDGSKQLPIQEDETALVLWALWQYFQRFPDAEFIKPFYRSLIIRSANWMASYRDLTDRLPLPSWDLWEERHGVFAWTIATTWAGLQAAANFAQAFGESRPESIYRQAAQEIQAATLELLWQPELNRFARMLNRKPTGGWEVDSTLDVSLCGLWYFGMISPDEPNLVATLQAVRDRLWVKTSVGGLARYENDTYQQVSQNKANVPGNPWFVATLWLAQWYIACAKTEQELKPALDLLQWVADHSLASGVMAEQVNPYTDAPISVSPLTWSHATYILTVREYIKKITVLDQQNKILI